MLSWISSLFKGKNPEKELPAEPLKPVAPIASAALPQKVPRPPQKPRAPSITVVDSPSATPEYSPELAARPEPLLLSQFDLARQPRPPRQSRLSSSAALAAPPTSRIKAPRVEDLSIHWNIENRKLTTAFHQGGQWAFEGTQYVLTIRTHSKCHLALEVTGCGNPDSAGELLLGIRPGSLEDLPRYDSPPPITTLLHLHKTIDCDFSICNREALLKSELNDKSQVELRVLSIPEGVNSPTVCPDGGVLTFNCTIDDVWVSSKEMTQKYHHTPETETIEFPKFKHNSDS